MSDMSVSQWYGLMGIHPWHGMQLANSLIPLSSKCAGIVYEEAWHHADRAGRRQIREAIERAAHLCRLHTRRWPAPRFVEETIAFPAGAGRVSSDGRWLALLLPDADLIALGPPAETGAATVALTYADDDDDGLYETATATATVPAGTLAAEVVARFTDMDCGGFTPPDILPRAVAVSGTTATLTFDTWDLVRPVRYRGASTAPLDPGVNVAPGPDVCAAAVTVARRRADPTGTTLPAAAVVLTWETRPWPAWACCVGDATTDPAATAQAVARGVIRDARTGVIGIGEAAYDAATGTWAAACDWRACRPPDRVTVRYQAGVARDGTRMAEPWASVIARLAAADLGRGVCACDGANHALYDAQKDLSQTGATDDLYQAPADFTNPIGSRRGQIAAWRHFQQQQRLVGIAG